MWEFCVKAGLENKDIIVFLHNTLKGEMLSVGGVCVLVERAGQTNLALACNKTEYKKIENVVKKALCDAICEKMKYKFLKNNINILIDNEELFLAFIKVYTYFDIELEKQLTIRLFDLSKNMVLESFLNFKLPFLKAKWKEMCNITNMNSGVFLRSGTFLELLKFLIANLECKTQNLIIDFSEGCKIFEQKKQGKNIIKSLNSDDVVEILTSIIELSPQKIKIITKEKSSEIVCLICDLFLDRVEIIK
ncbi:MAG: hypothetical protein IJ837_00155 [Clostridia bacterium]|nr:hypothetical protein [Clostridia bacterium]